MRTSGITMNSLIILPILVHTALAAPESYKFYAVGLDAGGFEAFIHDVNDLGIVVGGVVLKHDEPAVGVSWENGVLTNYDEWCWSEEASMSGTIRGISEFGHVAGAGGSVTNYYSSACYHGETIAFEIPAECQWNGGLEQINSSGAMAVGYCYGNSTWPTVHFVADGSTVNIGLFPDLDPDDAATARARDVNEYGLVVGSIDDLSGELPRGRAFFWLEGQLVEIFDDLGGNSIAATGVNDKNHIVGIAVDEFENDHAFIIRDGVMESMGLGEADGVNDRDVACGNINTVDGVHAAVFDQGQIVDLDVFLPPTWGSSYAWAINNYGWVVGTSSKWPKDFGFLLVPIYPKGDFDGDNDVDLHDFGHFQECFAAEPYLDGTLHVGCSVFDFDDDVDLDGDDYAAFQAAFTGAITSGW